MTVASPNQVLFLLYPGRCLFSAMKRTNAPRALQGSLANESGSVSVKKSNIMATARTVTSSTTWMTQNCSYTRSWMTWGSARFIAVLPPPPPPLLLLLFLTNSCWKTVASQPVTVSRCQGRLLHLVCLLILLPSPKKQSCASRQRQRFDPGPLVMFKSSRFESFIVSSTLWALSIILWIIQTERGLFGNYGTNGYIKRKSGKGILSGAVLHADASGSTGEYLCMHERVSWRKRGEDQGRLHLCSGTSPWIPLRALLFMHCTFMCGSIHGGRGCGQWLKTYWGHSNIHRRNQQKKHEWMN